MVLCDALAIFLDSPFEYLVLYLPRHMRINSICFSNVLVRYISGNVAAGEIHRASFLPPHGT